MWLGATAGGLLGGATLIHNIVVHDFSAMAFLAPVILFLIAAVPVWLAFEQHDH
jgi:predicted lipid-binding transport protein (Tim44 family)